VISQCSCGKRSAAQECLDEPGAPPDIGVEVVTPRDGRRERVIKKHDYAQVGVRQYWIVDPELRTLEVLVRSEQGRFRRALAEASGVHAVPHRRVELNLDALWAELDRWSAVEEQSE